MGQLEDAIKSHLEIKRKAGASEEEIDKLERQALGLSTEADQPLIAPPPVKPIPYQSSQSSEAATAAEVVSTSQAEVTPDSEMGSDAEEIPLDSDQSSSESTAHIEEPKDTTAETEPSEGSETEADEKDILEETPEFLEKAPDQEQLWFEQRPPKDFDF